MSYKVTKQYPRGRDTFCADFSDLNEAKKYIFENLGAEAAMNVQVTYRIYEWDELVSEFDASNLPKSEDSSSTESGGGAGKGSSVSFKPTPFSTTPRPAGGPQGWVKDDEEEDGDKKE